MTDQIKLAWASGFWDGEGCVSISKRPKSNNPRLVAEVSQVDRKVLDKFTEIVGFGKVFGPHKQKNVNGSDYYRWCVEGIDNMNRLYALLGPELSEAKRTQFEKSILIKQQWEDDPRCMQDHSMTKDSIGRWICRPCISEKATKRWSVSVMI